MTIGETVILTENNTIRFSIKKQDRFYNIINIAHLHQNILSDYNY